MPKEKFQEIIWAEAMDKWCDGTGVHHALHAVNQNGHMVSIPVCGVKAHGWGGAETGTLSYATRLCPSCVKLVKSRGQESEIPHGKYLPTT